MVRIPYFVWVTLLYVALVACTPQATVEFDPDIAIPLGQVEDLQFSDTSSLSISDCEERLTQITEPKDVQEGDVIPSDFVLLIDLDEVYLDWENFPLEALCAKGSWGLFRTSDTMELPTIAKIWAIDVNQ